MHPAIRRTEGNLVVLRPSESQRQAELAEAIVAALREQARPEPEVDQYADLRVAVRVGMWVLVVVSVLAVVGGPG